MKEQLQQLHQRALTWGASANEQGWLGQDAIDRLDTLEVALPDALFEDTAMRPLVVAFFGGTGVGKSSLLNRLAGESVAKTGITRPTSYEVTLYHHQAVQLSQLPEEFPVEQIQTAQHNDDARRDLVWIDMPDVDSTAEENKVLVERWLPYIDVLVYVVSPERYKDDRGWQILQERAKQSAWLFVMNHWDRGVDIQAEDFTQLLQDAGFADPLLFKTSCGGAEGVTDEFASLEGTVAELSQRHRIDRLSERGVVLRLSELRNGLQSATASLGDAASYAGLFDRWQERWTQVGDEICEGLAWSIEQNSQRFATQDASLFSLFRRQETAQATPVTTRDDMVLWDDWATTRSDDAVERLLLSANDNALAVEPLDNRLSTFKGTIGSLVRDTMDGALRQALAKPGNALQRLVRRLAGFLMVVAPLSAAGWAAYLIFFGFYQGASGDTAFLGSDFAIHSILLVGISWLLPFLIHRYSKPSMEKVARKAMTQGLRQGLVRVSDEMKELLRLYEQDYEKVAKQADEINHSVTVLLQREVGESDELLAQVSHGR